MAEQYIQQPDGKWAIWSTVVDTLTGIDFTEEELIAFAVKEVVARETEIRNYLENKKAGRVTQFSVSWEEAVAQTRRHAKGDPEFLEAVLVIRAPEGKQ